MSPERTHRENNVNPVVVWGPIVITRIEGRDLTPDQQRAFEIRAACLRIADSIGQLIEDPDIQQDPIREASAIGAYWEGMLKIQDLGVTENMHVGDDLDSFGEPRKIAEYVAGQLIGIDGENLPNVRQALSAIQEHAEEEMQFPGSSPDQGLNMFVMPTKNMQPKLKDWLVLRSMVNITHHLLAFDLDSPAKDKQIKEIVDQILTNRAKEDTPYSGDYEAEETSAPELHSIYFNDEGTLEVYAGSMFSSTLAEAVNLAAYLTQSVTFEFNGVNVTVAGDSDPELVRRDWSRAMSGYIDQNVGPYPRIELTEEELANDRRIEAENQKRYERREKRRRAKEAAKRRRVETRLEDAPEMEVSDEEAWQKYRDANKDSYGGGVISYAERWARLMQLDMTEGKALIEIAEKESHEADLEGITGFMYGAAVSTLSQTWKHGDQLRRWHNLKTQIRDEGERANESGGVLNPALLNIDLGLE